MAGNTVRVVLTGPTVQGLAPRILEEMLQGAIAEVADYTRYEVLTQLDKVLVNPTGYYESQVVADRRTPYTWSVNDSNVVYGPWLEGTGSRNSPVTRFPGYHTFRIVQGRMSQKRAAIVEAWLSRTVRRL